MAVQPQVSWVNWSHRNNASKPAFSQYNPFLGRSVWGRPQQFNVSPVIVDQTTSNGTQFVAFTPGAPVTNEPKPKIPILALVLAYFLISR